VRSGSEANTPLTLRPQQLGALVTLVTSGTISSSTDKDVLSEVVESGSEPAAVVKAKGLGQISDESAIAAAVDAVLAENAKAVADYKAGNQRILGALVGQVMKKMGGKANPSVINKLIAERIER
jgi:Asp-tRNA(Asn)/Glu-tRNA(Gln) amidotransferase B subunit